MRKAAKKIGLDMFFSFLFCNFGEARKTLDKLLPTLFDGIFHIMLV